MQIDAKKLLQQFNKEYNFLYENNDLVAGYEEAVNAFDKFITENNKFVIEFVNYRGDFISSDREAAAFMFALETFN